MHFAQLVEVDFSDEIEFEQLAALLLARSNPMLVLLVELYFQWALIVVVNQH